MWWFFLSWFSIIIFTVVLSVKIKCTNVLEYLKNGGLFQLLIAAIFLTLAEISLKNGIEYIQDDAIMHYIDGNYEIIIDEGIEPIYRIIPTDYD